MTRGWAWGGGAEVGRRPQGPGSGGLPGGHCGGQGDGHHDGHCGGLHGAQLAVS